LEEKGSNEQYVCALAAFETFLIDSGELRGDLRRRFFLLAAKMAAQFLLRERDLPSFRRWFLPGCPFLFEHSSCFGNYIH